MLSGLTVFSRSYCSLSMQVSCYDWSRRSCVSVFSLPPALFSIRDQSGRAGGVGRVRQAFFPFLTRYRGFLV